jgi:hypothetical protein
LEIGTRPPSISPFFSPLGPVASEVQRTRAGLPRRYVFQFF